MRGDHGASRRAAIPVAAVPLTTGLAAVLAATASPTAKGDESGTVVPEPGPLEPRDDVDILRR